MKEEHSLARQLISTKKLTNKLYIRLMASEKYSKLKDYLDNFAEDKWKELVYLLANDMREAHRCVYCNIGARRFRDIKLGYVNTCSVSCQHRYRTSQTAKTRHALNEDGISGFALSALKGAETQRTTICENGKSLLENTTVKIRNTLLNRVDDKGNNAYKVAAQKMLATRRGGDIDTYITGATKAKLTQTTADELGITGYQYLGMKVAKTQRQLYADLKDERNTGTASVYLFFSPLLNLVKIGWSSNVAKRKVALQKWASTDVELIDNVDGDYFSVREFEKYLHSKFDAYNKILPQKSNGRTEWFDMCIIPECLAEFKEWKEKYEIRRNHQAKIF